MANIWENAVITNKGVELQAKILAGGTITITKVKTGAGTVPITQLNEQLAVSNVKQTASVQPFEKNGNIVVVPVMVSNEGLTTAYDLRQVGFYATDPDEGEILYAIAQNTEPRQIPTAAESPGYALYWKFHFALSNDVNLEVEVDHSGFITRDELTDMQNKIDSMTTGIPIVVTTGTGSAYQATIKNVNELTVGMKITIIPHVVSNSTAPTLNVNALGAKTIKMPSTLNTSDCSAPTAASWLAAGKPVTVTWDGTQWETDIQRPSASSLVGTVPIANGGTGATTAAAARSNLGAAATSHSHAASEITSGTFSSDRLPTVPIAKGGTGATTAAQALTNLGAAAASHKHSASDINSGTLGTDRLPTVPVSKGGTGATDATTARTNLGITPANIGASPSDHKHNASDITGGTLSSDRLPTVPITKGGTGATTAAAARSNLGAVSMEELPYLYLWNVFDGDPTPTETEVTNQTVTYKLSSQITLYNSVSYSDAIDTSSGVVKLVNPTTISYPSVTSLEDAKGKYLKACQYVSMQQVIVYLYIPSDATFTEANNTISVSEAKKIEAGASKVGYGISKESGTYPTNGTHTDGKWYVYNKQLGE